MRWRRSLAASLAGGAALACARAPAPQRPTDEATLRVGLRVDVAAVELGGQGPVAAIEEGRTVFRLRAGERIRLAAAGSAVTVAEGSAQGRYRSLRFASLDPNRFVTVEGKPYRGAVEVLAGGSGLTVVNHVAVESYLAGVVSAEMGSRASTERAALEAQAIVSRTYALAARGRSAGQRYDLQGGTTDQVYGGVGAETEQSWAAVRRTTRRVITYQGRLIEAFFHSTCGYATAAPEEVFSFGRPLPYLRPVSDRRPGGYYCDLSPKFRWTVEWEGDELRRILRRTVPAVLGIEADLVDVIEHVRVHRTGPSGRAVEIRVRVGNGEIPVFGPDVRAVFTTPNGGALGSSAVQLRTERSGGRVERLVAEGAGWGHGVGLCQWGAVGRARAGQDAHTIIATYFPGTRIERWY